MGSLEVPPSLLGIGASLNQRTQKPGESKKPKKAIFGSFLRKAEESEEIPEGIEGLDDGRPLSELLDGVTSLGEDLKKDPNTEAIRKYKSAVRRFMARVVKDAFQYEEKSGGNAFLKRKKYSIIRIVDEKLEQLAAGILQHQHDQMEILRRLDEIRGLLVDLVQ